MIPSASGGADFSLNNELRGRSTEIVFRSLHSVSQRAHLRKLPLIERKAALKTLVAGTNIQFSESFEVDGPEMFACKLGRESVVSKVRYSEYPTGTRSRDWVKKPCAQRETLAIAGFALDGNKWDDIYAGRPRQERPPNRRAFPDLSARLGSGPSAPYFQASSLPCYRD
ncbi:hypothetical protein [Bradyrhizobium sp. RD5-C2]|uniref:hypothetical protein n=1 Tax=Bradyrhizobium sp. RD5-C2 TaxID=244562 RepID=UPI001CC5ADA9|nr:hypothetical protein [Bradyrhizobium sp. RD5-C2]GIQ75527.1 hypothetical protein BraRD5C2_39680 [Bradyrhizobium sp. RD5-C2]